MRDTDEGMLGVGETLASRRKTGARWLLVTWGLSAAILAVLWMGVAPKLVSLFEELGMAPDQFPLPTLLLKRLSEFLLHYWWLCILLVAAPLAGLVCFVHTEAAERHHAALQVVSIVILCLLVGLTVCAMLLPFLVARPQLSTW